MNDNQPKVGDILFIRSREKGSGFSQVIQRIIDPDARFARRSFSHVAIVVDDDLTLEATFSPEATNTSQSFKLPQSVEKGTWTEAELRGGVRLVPTPDVIFPLLPDTTAIAVMRAIEPPSLTMSPFDPVILRLLGSQYSIDGIKAKVLAWLPDSISNALNVRVNWTSKANDLASLADISPELRQSIATRLPNYALPDAARTFFCSQLVIIWLVRAGLLHLNDTAELTTPTGLFGLLESKGWTEVTSVDEHIDESQYFGMAISSVRASYYETLALTDIAIQGQALEFARNFAEETLAAMSRLTDETLTRLKRLR